MSYARMGRALPLALVLVLAMTAPATAVSWGPVSPITTSGQADAWAGSTAAYNGGIAVVYREIVDAQYRVFIGQHDRWRRHVDDAKSPLVPVGRVCQPASDRR